MKIINPYTQKLIKEVPEDHAESVKAKFHRSQVAQKEWAHVSLEKKIEIIKKFRGLLVENKESLAMLLTEEVGKPLQQSRNELVGVLGRIDFFIEKVAATLSVETVLADSGKKLVEKISHEPLGVIANISAWNFPYFVGANVFIPALLTGNSVLYKPSEYATLTGLEIEKMMHQAGVPDDIFITIIGGGAVGQQLLAQDIRGVFFTGSYATGKKIQEAVASKLIKTQLELGGKDPIYVCDDVDVAAAAAGIADGAMYNNGQSCCSVERVYVHEKIYDQFLKSFVETVKDFKTGDPQDEKTYIGALTRGELQVQVLEKQVADAKAKGAQLLIGGNRSIENKSVFMPTVFSHVNHTMELMIEESFGPIIGIQKVGSDEEALKLMNDTDYGLTAGVYTRNQHRAEKLLTQAHAGSVYWNCCDRVSPRLPWSGRGHSGIGSTLSTYGILAFTQPKSWHFQGPA